MKTKPSEPSENLLKAVQTTDLLRQDLLAAHHDYLETNPALSILIRDQLETLAKLDARLKEVVSVLKQ